MRCFIALAALISAPIPAFAVPITIDVTGTIRTYLTHDNSPFGVDQTATLSHLDVHGFVTYDLGLAPPAVTRPFGDGGVYERSSIGLPFIEFVSASLTWANGTFIAAPLFVPVGATAVGDALLLTNSIGSPDDFVIADQFGWQNESGAAALSRTVFRFEDDFISDAVAIPTGTEFPDLARALSRVFVQSVSVTSDDVLNGFQLGIDVTAASVRAVQVPEPGMLTLLSLGLAGLGISFQVRRSSARADGGRR
jgi:hypothetical protein